jgi:hypothetical protein
MGIANMKSLVIAATLVVALSMLFAGCCDETTIVEEVEVEVPGECDDVGEFVEVFPALGTLSYRGIWGSSESNIFAVGDYGGIAHFDGSGWELMSSGTKDYLYAVWGSGPNDVYAVGERGRILHYDGSGWERVIVLTTDYLACIWGTGPDDIHVGAAAYMHHFDGVEWTSGDYLGSYYTKYGMWGSSPTNIFCVGYQGRIYHFDGTGWTDISDQVSTSRSLRGIWGTDSTNIYVVGEYGVMLHHDGNTWTDISDPLMEGYTLYQISGRSANDIYVAASYSRVFHFNGSAWEEIADYDDLSGYQYAIWAGPSNTYSVGEDGEISTYDGAEWTSAHGGPYEEFESVWVGSSTDAVAVGDNSQLYRYDGTSWYNEGSVTSEFEHYYGVSGETGNLFVSGAWGLLLHNDGSGWADISNSGVTGEYLYDIWSQGGQAIAVGEDGEGVYYDGSMLSLMTTGTTDYLWGVWGSSPTDVFAVGSNGVIIHYDGNVSKVWEHMDSGVTTDFEDVWGTAHDNVYACGLAGTLLHYDGSTWERVWIDVSANLYGIGGTAEDDVYVVSYDDVYHFDGTSWYSMPQTATYQSLYDITCGADGSTFAVGNEGTIVYKQP